MPMTLIAPFDCPLIAGMLCVELLADSHSIFFSLSLSTCWCILHIFAQSKQTKTPIRFRHMKTIRSERKKKQNRKTKNNK